MKELREFALASGAKVGDVIKGFKVKSIDVATGFVEFTSPTESESQPVSLGIDGLDLSLTRTDGGLQTVTLPQTTCSWNPTTRVLGITQADGKTTSLVLDLPVLLFENAPAVPVLPAIWAKPVSKPLPVKRKSWLITVSQLTRSANYYLKFTVHNGDGVPVARFGDVYLGIATVDKAAGVFDLHYNPGGAGSNSISFTVDYDVPVAVDRINLVQSSYTAPDGVSHTLVQATQVTLSDNPWTKNVVTADVPGSNVGVPGGFDIQVSELALQVAGYASYTNIDGKWQPLIDETVVAVTPAQLEARLASLEIAGQYLGSVTTFAALPKASASNGDWATLTVDDGAYKMGGYVYNGVTFVYAFGISADFTSILGLKADKTQVATDLGLKADKSYTDTQLGLKADKTQVATDLGLKADKTQVATDLGLKADKTQVNQIVTDLGTKVAISAKADDAAVTAGTADRWVDAAALHGLDTALRTLIGQRALDSALASEVSRAKAVENEALLGRTINKAGHGFTVGMPLGLDASGNWFRCDNTSADSAEVIGVVAAVVDAAAFRLVTEGYISGLPNDVLGVYFVGATPGTLTATAPVAPAVHKPVLIRDTATTGYVVHRPTTVQ